MLWVRLRVKVACRASEVCYSQCRKATIKPKRKGKVYTYTTNKGERTMSRKKQNKSDDMRGLKGWEKKYLLQSIKYGHLKVPKNKYKVNEEVSYASNS